MDNENTMTTEDKEQATIEKTCKKAVADCMHAAKFAVYTDDPQIEMKANTALGEDATLSRPVYIAAYQAAQAALISKPSQWSITTTPSQILQSMLFVEKHSDQGFDGAYEYIRDRVEAAVATLRESETP